MRWCSSCARKETEGGPIDEAGSEAILNWRRPQPSHVYEKTLLFCAAAPYSFCFFKTLWFWDRTNLEVVVCFSFKMLDNKIKNLSTQFFWSGALNPRITKVVWRKLLSSKSTKAIKWWLIHHIQNSTEYKTSSSSKCSNSTFTLQRIKTFLLVPLGPKKHVASSYLFWKKSQKEV